MTTTRDLPLPWRLITRILSRHIRNYVEPGRGPGSGSIGIESDRDSDLDRSGPGV
jgi:hypothetical protein